MTRRWLKQSLNPVRPSTDFEIPKDGVNIYRDSTQLIIEPMRKKNLLEVLAELEPLGPNDSFPDVDNTLLPAKKVQSF